MFTLYRHNTQVVNKKINPREEFKKNNGSVNSYGAPFRMPFNHYRKTTFCPKPECKTNQKILQDTAAYTLGNNSCLCYDPTIRSYLNKDGKPEHKFIFNASNVLYKNKKTLEQNNISNITSSIPIDGNNVYNASYENPNDPNNTLQEPCHRIVHKITNNNTQRIAATSQRNRINRLRYNNSTARNNYNNYGQCADKNSKCYDTYSKNKKSFPTLCSRRRRRNKKLACLQNNS